MGIAQYLIPLLVSKFAAADMLEHPIQVSSSNISTVVFEDNASVSFNIEQTVLDLLISSVAKDKDEYHVFFIARQRSWILKEVLLASRLMSWTLSPCRQVRKPQLIVDSESDCSYR